MKYVLYAKETAPDQHGLFKVEEADYTKAGYDRLSALGRKTPGCFITSEKGAVDCLTEPGAEDLLSSLVDRSLFPKPSFSYPAGGETQVCYGATNGVWSMWTVRNNVLGAVYPLASRDDAARMCDDFINTFKQAGVIA